MSRAAPRAEPLWDDRIRRFVRTPKGMLTLAFAPLLLLGGTAEGWGSILPHVLAALAGACVVELLADGLAGERIRWPSSAILSSLIVAFVLGPDVSPLATFSIGALATSSKYLIATRRGHIFNPAALALLLSVPVYAADQSWWGALPDLAWPWLLVLLLGGVVVVDRVGKFPLALAFLMTYFGLFTAVGVVDPARVAEMFRDPFVNAALFLAAFMLTDPPTAAGKPAEQIWVGMLVAVAAVAAQLLGAGQAYLLVGLLAGNAATALARAVGPRAPAQVPAVPSRAAGQPRAARPTQHRAHTRVNTAVVDAAGRYPRPADDGDRHMQRAGAHDAAVWLDSRRSR